LTNSVLGHQSLKWLLTVDLADFKIKIPTQFYRIIIT
jgi:hypothetical protein